MGAIKKSQLGYLMSPRKFGAPSGNCGSLRKPRGSGKLARADCNSRSTFFSRGNSAAGQLLGGKEMAPRFHRKCLNSFFWQVLFCNKSSCSRLIRLFSTMSSYSPLCSSKEFQPRTFISWLGDTTLTSDFIFSMIFAFCTVRVKIRPHVWISLCVCSHVILALFVFVFDLREIYSDCAVFALAHVPWPSSDFIGPKYFLRHSSVIIWLWASIS